MNDALQGARKLDFIRSQLDRYAGTKKETGTRMMVLCPYHSESTPSGSIWLGERGTGFFRCFACSARAPWDEVAPRLGLEPFVRGKPKAEASMDLLMSKALTALTSQSKYRKDTFKFWPIPKNKKWRTIPTNFLRELGGRMCIKYDERYGWSSSKFLYFPVMVNGHQYGFFRARIKKEKDKPSYLLAAAESGSQWALTHGLWNFDYCRELMAKIGTSTVVIVEGQRDAMRLWMNGIPALCIFGTQSWTEDKAKLLEMAGVETVIVMMDGDCAGIDATNRIAPSLKSLFEVKVVRLWSMRGSPYIQFKDEPEPSKAAKAAGVDLWDPGNCPQRILDKLKTKYFS
jgi:5S rRNA maturation endonuclease (ribonuclease M5)